MFKRIIFDDWVMVFPLVAFVTAACIFGCFVYRALRMRRSQADHFAQLPFQNESASRHDHAVSS
jgi:hypothetical protein